MNQSLAKKYYSSPKALIQHLAIAQPITLSVFFDDGDVDLDQE